MRQEKVGRGRSDDLVGRHESRVRLPWSEEAYPPAMHALPPLVRRKAIEIANALLAEGHEEGFAIRVGIARAREWAMRRGLDREDW